MSGRERGEIQALRARKGRWLVEAIGGPYLGIGGGCMGRLVQGRREEQRGRGREGERKEREREVEEVEEVEEEEEEEEVEEVDESMKVSQISWPDR